MSFLNLKLCLFGTSLSCILTKEETHNWHNEQKKISKHLRE